MITPNESRAIARLAQVVRGDDALMLHNLQRDGLPLASYPEEWQRFVYGWIHEKTVGKSVGADALKFNDNHDEQGRFTTGDGSNKNEEVSARISETRNSFDGSAYNSHYEQSASNVRQGSARYTSDTGKEYVLRVETGTLDKPTTEEQHGVDVLINQYATVTAHEVSADGGSGLQVGSFRANDSKVLDIAVDPDNRRQGLGTAMLELARRESPTPIAHSTDLSDDGRAFANAVKTSDITKAGVPGPAEVERALSRLKILPNPNHPELKDPEKYLESPWKVVPVPTINPNLWDDALVKLWDLNDLYATDQWLKRKNVKKHIEHMGQAMTPYRSFALVAVVEGKPIIIDGHHRLMASWLLGEDTAPAYTIEVK